MIRMTTSRYRKIFIGSLLVYTANIEQIKVYSQNNWFTDIKIEKSRS